MNPFYQRLALFGQLIERASNYGNTVYQDYFDIEHPAQPVIKFSKSVRPKLRFSKHCPKTVKLEIKEMFTAVFQV